MNEEAEKLVKERMEKWCADELRNAMQMFNGRDLNKPAVDTSPNRGSGWMGKR